MSPIPIIFLLIILYVAIHVSVAQFTDLCATSSGKLGKCVKVQQCPAAIELITQRKHPDLCKYDKAQPIVCCEIVEDNSSRIKREKPVRIAEQKCLEYVRQASPTTTTTTSGNTDTQQKVPADPLEFPHMATLGHGSVGSIQWRCGGTIISEKFILTTAFCSDWVFGRAIYAGIGYQQNSSTKFYAQHFKVKNIYQHPDFRYPQKYNDIALIEIDGQITFTPSGIRPACLQTEKEIDSDDFIGTGWGTKYSETSSEIFQKMNLTRTSFETCSEEHKYLEGLENGLVDGSQLCANSFEDRPDTCQVDNGGPLQVELKGTSLYKIVGVRSVGPLCDLIPAVYTRVSYYVPWIENIVWPA